MPKINYKLTLVVIIAVAAGAVFALGNPHSESWLLKCPLHYLTGLQCPLCGSQRAIHEMLNGNIKEAWTLNPGFFVLMPYLIILLIGQIFPNTQYSNKVIKFSYRDSTIFAIIALMLLWGVIRNII